MPHFPDIGFAEGAEIWDEAGREGEICKGSHVGGSHESGYGG